MQITYIFTAIMFSINTDTFLFMSILSYFCFQIFLLKLKEMYNSTFYIHCLSHELYNSEFNSHETNQIIKISKSTLFWKILVTIADY